MELQRIFFSFVLCMLSTSQALWVMPIWLITNKPQNKEHLSYDFRKVTCDTSPCEVKGKQGDDKIIRVYTNWNIKASNIL